VTYDITPPITAKLAVWPGDTPLSREVLNDMARGDNITLSTLRATMHLGAHADGPNHYGKDAPAIDERGLDYFLGPCHVIRVEVARATRILPEMLADVTRQLPAGGGNELASRAAASAQGSGAPGERMIHLQPRVTRVRHVPELNEDRRLRRHRVTDHDRFGQPVRARQQRRADLGVAKTSDGRESQYARSRVVNAARAAGVQAIDSVFSDIADMDGLRRWGGSSRALGFEGMGCIHPSQIAVIHDAFTPSQAEFEQALKIVAAFEEAQQRGLRVVSLGSKMIDAPVVERARKLVARSRAGARAPH